MTAKNNGDETPCERCEFYEYDDEEDCYVCNVRLDEDEMAEFVAKTCHRCPYFRYYDEYTSVRRQN